jgi:hypothetical protein
LSKIVFPSRLAASLLFVLTATEAVSQTVRVRWERSAEKKEYLTYAWLEGTHVQDEQTHRYIVDYVDAQLGINSVFKDENAPDAYVVYHASAKSSFEISGGYHYDWKDAEAITVASHSAGTLVIDIVDAAENRVIWRAIATATITGNQKKNRDKVIKAVQKMFADFPPGR